MQSEFLHRTVLFMFFGLKSYLLTPSKRLRRWEVVLLVILAGAILCCSWLSWRQQQLASRMVRLHVIANSDSEDDQALKLRVRDAVLEQASAYLDGVSDVDQAAQVLGAHLEELSRAGQAVVEQQGYSYPVSATLETTHFPTKSYDEFALPAGDYRALRVVIGEGDGQNWWCVVFPTLCVSAASTWQDTAVSGGLTEDDVALMSGEEEGYVLRFKCLELWDKLQNMIGN